MVLLCIKLSFLKYGIILPQNGALAIHSDAPHTNLPHSVLAWVGPPHVVDTPAGGKKDHWINKLKYFHNKIFLILIV